MNVVELRSNPCLLDIAGQLRALASRIESGEQSIEWCSVVIITPDEFKPVFFGWGKIPDRHGIAGVFTHCAQLALTDIK